MVACTIASQVTLLSSLYKVTIIYQSAALFFLLAPTKCLMIGDLMIVTSRTRDVSRDWKLGQLSPIKKRLEIN